FCSMRDCGQSGRAEFFVVVTTSGAVEERGPSEVTEDGATLQEAPAGRPEQLNIKTLLNPPRGVTETVYVADCPGLTAAVPGLMDTVVGSTFSNRAPAPETNGALKDAIRQRRC